MTELVTALYADQQNLSHYMKLNLWSVAQKHIKKQFLWKPLTFYYKLVCNLCATIAASAPRL